MPRSESCMDDKADVGKKRQEALETRCTCSAFTPIAQKPKDKWGTSPSSGGADLTKRGQIFSCSFQGVLAGSTVIAIDVALAAV